MDILICETSNCLVNHLGEHMSITTDKNYAGKGPVKYVSKQELYAKLIGKSMIVSDYPNITILSNLTGNAITFSEAKTIAAMRPDLFVIDLSAIAPVYSAIKSNKLSNILALFKKSVMITVEDNLNMDNLIISAGIYDNVTHHKCRFADYSYAGLLNSHYLPIKQISKLVLTGRKKRNPDEINQVISEIKYTTNFTAVNLIIELAESSKMMPEGLSETQMAILDTFDMTGLIDKLRLCRIQRDTYKYAEQSSRMTYEQHIAELTNKLDKYEKIKDELTKFI